MPRIIAGDFRGRRLKAPRGLQTRPTIERVREAVFNILGRRVRRARVLDLFAGTGAMGLEALSRGAARVTFAERDRDARNALVANIGALGVGESAEVLGGDAAEALRALAARGEVFDLILMDPPYGGNLVASALRAAAAVAAPGALAVAEHHFKDEAPEDVSGFHLRDRRRYGDTAVSFYEHCGEPAAAPHEEPQ